MNYQLKCRAIICQFSVWMLRSKHDLPVKISSHDLYMSVVIKHGFQLKFQGLQAICQLSVRVLRSKHDLSESFVREDVESERHLSVRMLRLLQSVNQSQGRTGTIHSNICDWANQICQVQNNEISACSLVKLMMNTALTFRFQNLSSFTCYKYFAPLRYLKSIKAATLKLEG